MRKSAVTASKTISSKSQNDVDIIERTIQKIVKESAEVGLALNENKPKLMVLWFQCFFLENLDNTKVRVVPCADDVVVMVTGPFISVVSEVMQNILKEINTWATGCGPGVNPDKTNLLKFTKKRVIPHSTTG